MLKKSLIALALAVTLALPGCIHMRVLEIKNEAEQLYKEGRHKEIIPLVEQGMAEVERELGPDHPYMGLGYNSLAILYAYTMNDFVRAQDYFQRALAIRTKALGPEHPDTIQTINQMGFLYQVTGDRKKAEEHYLKALALRTKVLGPTHPETSDSQSYLAQLYLMEGRYAEAEALLKEAVKHETQEISTRHPTPAFSQSMLGALYYSLGDLERSEKWHREALEISEASLPPDHTELAPSLDNLAAVLMAKQDVDGAEAYALRALAIKEKGFGRYHGFTGDSLLFLGRLQSMRGDQEKAADYFNQALEVYERVLGPDNWRTLVVKLWLAGLDVNANNLARAKTRSEEALASPGLSGLAEAQWSALTVYSIVLARSGKPNAAIFYGKRAVNIVQGMRAGISGMEQALQKGFLVGREGAFRHLAALLIEQGRLAEAQQVLTMIKEEEHFDFIRRDAGRGLIRTTSAEFTPAERAWLGRYEEISGRIAAIGAEYETLKRKKAQEGLSEAEEARQKALREDLGVAGQAFRQFLAELEQQLDTVSRKRAMELGEKNLDDLKALQGDLRELGPNVVLVHYLITDDKLYAILTTARAQIVRHVEVARGELNRQVYTLREAVQDSKRDPRPAAKALYDLVLGPIVKDLRQAKARTVMFAMDGVLRYVPVAALYDGERYLAEDYEVILFTEAAKSKLTRKPAKDWRLAGLGLTRAVGEFSPLPSVAAELQSIVRTGDDDAEGVLPGIVYLDEKFTEAAVVEVLDEAYPVLHVASHFVFRPGTERDSYLVLGDGNKLSLAHILDEDLDFNGVDLLTLSACETALGGEGADGREIEGFGWLAQRQGAKAVLATLWPVADESTAKFMYQLYDHRQSGGMTKAAALRQVQMEFIASGTYAHPYYWAPFILMGNWL